MGASDSQRTSTSQVVRRASGSENRSQNPTECGIAYQDEGGRPASRSALSTGCCAPSLSRPGSAESTNSQMVRTSLARRHV